MVEIIKGYQPTPTHGFDVYWKFAAERQRIYNARLAGVAGRFLTTDPVLMKHRFTNAYRAADRVSQYLIKFIQYNGQWNWTDTFVRTMVFKLFNRIDTWKHLVETIGEPDCTLLFDRAIDRSLSLLAKNHPVYSPAYVMPPPRDLSGPKYIRHLSLLRRMVADGAQLEIRRAQSMEEAYLVLRRYPSIGDFLAYQFITDLNYSVHLNLSEDEFVAPGPGALRGLRKCFVDTNSLSDVYLIHWTFERQWIEFEERKLDWTGLWGRDLQLIDIQNLFCEVDKYTRVAVPELSKYASGTRIKQRYRPNPEPLTAWFPPKWGLNDHIQMSLRSQTLMIQLHFFSGHNIAPGGQFPIV